jgi:DHA1 family L-arabinose/isopropyl-beta-D-thiogalactopyranoside export protein-like MFS transporter/DHA1 family inner membrane transport protein
MTVISRDRADSRHAWAALAALSLGCFTFVTTENLPIGLLTAMASDLHRSESSIGLLITGYAVVVVLVSVPLTHVTRSLRRRTVLAATLATLIVTALASAAAPSYRVLFAARVATALVQALYWSVVTPAVAELFAPNARGRALSLLFTGTSLAPVLGVPACTWLGQQAGWRTAFVALSVLAAACAAVLLRFLPRSPSAAEDVSIGSTPDSRRYAVAIGVTVLGIAGALAAYTYITPFLLEITGFSRGSLAALLAVEGAAGVAGSLATGRFLDRHPRGVIIVGLAVHVVGFGLLWAAGTVRIVAIVVMALVGLGLSCVAAGLSAHGLHIAPRRTDIASAGISSAYNAGIAGGSWAGGLALTQSGVRSTPLTAMVLVGAALLLALAEPVIARRRPPETAPGRTTAGDPLGSPAVGTTGA